MNYAEVTVQWYHESQVDEITLHPGKQQVDQTRRHVLQCSNETSVGAHRLEASTSASGTR
ncbi:hypothetical protein M407DRAFT_244395 [Tulasnella calospora MUT 4182]|uniref:Uncharacterized protein n=1 Tax=Tulasnella calospora MUT 4182 TaxID=1051891 RepID=A0A0C3QEX5_9AGAM|nr:hypothetical protein M407DRAFT_244395 [Tulasnella calospora MUT 4182]